MVWGFMVQGAAFRVLGFKVSAGFGFRRRRAYGFRLDGLRFAVPFWGTVGVY